MNTTNDESAAAGGDRMTDSYGVCDRIGVRMRTFRDMLKDKRFPQADYKSGRLHRWKLSTVREWIASQGVAK